MSTQYGPNQSSFTNPSNGLLKVPTHIEGLDQILHGGLPAGRVTLINGGPGTGKTVLGLEIIYRSALDGNAGIFFSFEENADNLRQNARSVGWDLAALEKIGKMALVYGNIDFEAVNAGTFNVKGLLAIIEGKAKAMSARIIVIDALDVLISLINDPMRAQQQLLGLFKWLGQQNLTAILTSKNQQRSHFPSPENQLDFMADCVIDLDQRITNQVNTKRDGFVKSHLSPETRFWADAQNIWATSDKRLKTAKMAQNCSLKRLIRTR